MSDPPRLRDTPEFAGLFESEAKAAANRDLSGLEDRLMDALFRPPPGGTGGSSDGGGPGSGSAPGGGAGHLSSASQGIGSNALWLGTIGGIVGAVALAWTMLGTWHGAENETPGRIAMVQEEPPPTDAPKVAEPPPQDLAPPKATAPPEVTPGENKKKSLTLLKELRLYDEGRQALQKDQHSSAIRIFRRFLKKHPDSELAPEARFNLLEANARAGKYRAAERLAKKLLRKKSLQGRRAELLRVLADAQAARGACKAARKTLSRLQKSHPSELSEQARQAFMEDCAKKKSRP